MARPKAERFKLSCTIDVSSAVQSILLRTHVAMQLGAWPDRPSVADQLSDTDWMRLQRRSMLPDETNGIAVRALLEQEIANFRVAFAREQRAAPVKLKSAQLRAILKAEEGDPVPPHLHPEVIGLLAGMAWLDRRGGMGEWDAIGRCHRHVEAQRVVTPRLKDWAGWCLMLGVGYRSHDRNHGGGHSSATEVFISTLVNFWGDVLGRAQTSWVGEDRKKTTSAGLTRFVRNCLDVAGAKAMTARPRKKIKMGTSISKRPRKRPLSLGDVHQRILRVRKEMRAAAEAGLNPNVLSRSIDSVRGRTYDGSSRPS